MLSAAIFIWLFTLKEADMKTADLAKSVDSDGAGHNFWVCSFWYFTMGGTFQDCSNAKNK